MGRAVMLTPHLLQCVVDDNLSPLPPPRCRGPAGLPGPLGELGAAVCAEGVEPVVVDSPSRRGEPSAARRWERSDLS